MSNDTTKTPQVQDDDPKPSGVVRVNFPRDWSYEQMAAHIREWGRKNRLEREAWEARQAAKKEKNP